MINSPLASRFSASADRIHACTPWLARLLTLFSYRHSFTLSRAAGNIIVTTQSFWFRKRVRIVNFDRIDHIVYRAQELPNFAIWNYLWLDGAAEDWACFFIALALKNETAELPLMTVFERQPSDEDWLDKLTGDAVPQDSIGDEDACRVVAMLKQCTGAPINVHPISAQDVGS